MKKIPLLLIFTIVFNYLRAATVDTVSIRSNVMHTSFNCVVIKPAKLKHASGFFPVIYLLHGYSGKYSNWIIKVPILKNYADQYQVMIVCPDGGFSSWYLDSPVDSTMRYETYIGKEVPEYIDAHYPTIKDRKARAITGLSMGGYGGLFIAFRHSGFFGACGSMSGGVDLNSSRTRFDVIKRVGDTIAYASNWANYSLISVATQYQEHFLVQDTKTDSLSIIIDCGTDDIFYTSNHALHEKMVSLKIPHDYIERPGKHEWNYWGHAVEYQVLFFSNYFKRSY
jgi:S-formylglutathione hydrolase FrmB